MPPLEIARLTLLVLHFLGLAALLGPFLLQAFQPAAPRVRLMLAGAAVQVVSGNALIASRMLQGLGVDEVKMVTKLALAVLALIMLVVVRRRRCADMAPVRLPFLAAGTFAITDVVVAVIWT